MPRPHDKDDDYFTGDFDGSYNYGLNENQIRARMNYAINGEEDWDDEDDIPVDDGDEAQEEREIDEESDDPDAWNDDESRDPLWDDDDDDIKYLFDDDGAVSHRGMAILAEMDRNGHFV